MALKPYKAPGRAKLGYGRAKRGAKSAFFNAGGSKKARDPKTGDKIGITTPEQRQGRRRAANHSFKFGMIGGVVGGTVAGSAHYVGQTNRDRQAVRDVKIANWYDKNKVSKARPFRITAVGTRTERLESKRKYLHKPALAAGAGLTGTAITAAYRGDQKDARKQADRYYRGKKNRTLMAEFGKASYLERVEIPRGQRNKNRAKNAVAGGAGAAGTFEVLRRAENLGRKKIGVPKARFNNKTSAIIAGAGALGAATAKQEKTQYKAVHKSSTSAFGVDHG